MSVLNAILKSEETAKGRGWDKTYWFFDIHSTILKPNYEADNIPKEFYPFAKETLQLLSKRDDVCLGIYTCSHPHEVDQYLELFKSFDINFEMVNENPEVKTNINGYGNYDTKPYMNVLFEDKAGFNADTEWYQVLNYVKYGAEVKRKLYQVVEWKDLQIKLCEELGIENDEFRKYKGPDGSGDLWLIWLEFFESDVTNGHIIPFWLGDKEEIKLEWMKERNKDWAEPFVKAIYKVVDDNDITHIRYFW